MGTTADWIEITIGGVCFGGFLALWTTRKRTDGVTPWPRSIHQLMCCAFAGLLFGILVRFGWQAVHAPIVFVTLPAAVGILIFRFSAIRFASGTPRKK